VAVFGLALIALLSRVGTATPAPPPAAATPEAVAA